MPEDWEGGSFDESSLVIAHEEDDVFNSSEYGIQRMFTTIVPLVGAFVRGDENPFRNDVNVAPFAFQSKFGSIQQPEECCVGEGAIEVIEYDILFSIIFIKPARVWGLPVGWRSRADPCSESRFPCSRLPPEYKYLSLVVSLWC